MEKLFRTFKWHPNNARRCITTPVYPIVVVHGVDGDGRLHRREKPFQHQQTRFAIRRQMTSLFHYINYLCVRIYPMVGQHDKLLSFSFVILILLYYNILSAHTFTHSCCTTLFNLGKLPWKGSAAHTHTLRPFRPSNFSNDSNDTMTSNATATEMKCSRFNNNNNNSNAHEAANVPSFTKSYRVLTMEIESFGNFWQ